MEEIDEIITSIDTGSLTGCLAVVSSLFVPIAIMIYQEFKEKHAFNEFEWDKTVLLQKVIKGWQILGSILISSVSIMLWNYQNIWMKLVLFIIYSLGIIILVLNLAHLFKWFMSNKVGKCDEKNYRQQQKMKFLNKLDPNNSMDVWSNIFSTIEPENAYLKDYLRLFFIKFQNADKDQYWLYEQCLMRNMERLYYYGPDFQNEVIDFAFDAYVDNEDNKEEITYIKRAIVRRLFWLLVKNNKDHCFSISRRFDEKLAKIESEELVSQMVKDFSFDALSEIMGAYNKDSERNNYYYLMVFPTDKWNISALISSKDARLKAKAMGLFSAYLEMLPEYANFESDKINSKRVTFLEQITFGISGQIFSRKMITIVGLYYSWRVFSSYKKEDVTHALVRDFIDKDYKFLFMDNSLSISPPPFKPSEPEEQRLKRVMRKFSMEEKQRDKYTVELLSKIYGFLLNKKEMRAVKRVIAKYDLEDEKYQYRTEKNNRKCNLEDLKSTIDKIIEYNNTQR